MPCRGARRRRSLRRGGTKGAGCSPRGSGGSTGVGAGGKQLPAASATSKSRRVVRLSTCRPRSPRHWPAALSSVPRERQSAGVIVAWDGYPASPYYESSTSAAAAISIAVGSFSSSGGAGTEAKGSGTERRRTRGFIVTEIL